jgi:membrane protease YdiL (CAAX protease family)
MAGDSATARAAEVAARLSPALPYLAVGLGLFVAHNAWAAMALYHLGMLGVLAGERRLGTLRALGRGFQPWLLAGTIPLCLLGGGLTYRLWPLVGLPGLAGRLAQVGLTPGALPAFFLYFSLVNPVLEEVFWRGYHGHRSPWPVWGDLWFAGYHIAVVALFLRWQWLPLVLIGLVGIAWLWRMLAQRPGGMLTNIASHVAADLGLAAAVLLLLR